MTPAIVPYKFLGPPMSATRGSVTNSVTDLLRNAIVTLEFKPGEVLDKGAICDRLKVSRFPVSEALSRLQSEGLVDILPQRGSVVSLVRIADVIEYMTIRRALECEAVRVLVGNHPPELLAALERSMRQQRNAVTRDNQVAFHLRDLEFHEMLFEALHFAKLKSIIDSARANLDRARRLILNPRRIVETLTEHQAIVDGIRAGDAEAASTAMRRHIDSVIDEVVDFARQHPDLFADGETLTSRTAPAV